MNSLKRHLRLTIYVVLGKFLRLKCVLSEFLFCSVFVYQKSLKLKLNTWFYRYPIEFICGCVGNSKQLCGLKKN